MIIISGILSYSGISAKARAMGGKLLKKEQYEQLASCASVGEAVGYLRQFSEYEPLLRDFDEHDSHRGMIEATLMGSLYNDYNRLYSFARGEQRAFLDFYFLHYEAAYLKGCLRKVISGQSIQEDQAYRSAFFARHSHLDTDAIENSTTVDELIDALKNTPFYHPLDAIRHTEEPSLFDYEGSLDVYYFSYIWKQKDKLLKGKERQIIADSYGRRIDLLNIQWLMRAKKNYRMTAPELYAMVVPSYYHLKPDDITDIVEAPTYEEARLLIVNGYYGQKYADDFAEIRFVEKMYTELVEHIFELAGRKNPYSVAPLNALLYRKEHEIARITSIIEGIRYGITTAKLMKYAVTQ